MSMVSRAVMLCNIDDVMPRGRQVAPARGAPYAAGGRGSAGGGAGGLGGRGLGFCGIDS